MLDLTNFIQHAHRLPGYIDDSVANVYPGQLFQKTDDGKWEYSDGTKKAYPTLNSRYPGEGLGLQGERLEGRDDVSRTKQIACFKGNFEIGTDQYDKDATYVSGQPLHPSTDVAKKGLVTMYDSANPAHKAHFIVGYVTKVPVDDNDTIRYEG